MLKYLKSFFVSDEPDEFSTLKPWVLLGLRMPSGFGPESRNGYREVHPRLEAVKMLSRGNWFLVDSFETEEEAIAEYERIEAKVMERLERLNRSH